MNSVARFYFHGALREFLARERRGQVFEYSCARAATLKNAVEALGAPHTEVARATVNGEPATLDRLVREGDTVEVHPWTVQKHLDPLRFVADAHLGGLARFLRMLGFDTLHENTLSDAAIRRLAIEDSRIVLTRDRELLKCRDISSGCYVHECKPEAQLREVADRFDLAPQARPFTLCLICNLPLEPASAEQVRNFAPEGVLARYTEFYRCRGCERVFWKGSHYERMRAVLGTVLG